MSKSLGDVYMHVGSPLYTELTVRNDVLHNVTLLWVYNQMYNYYYMYIMVQN